MSVCAECKYNACAASTHINHLTNRVAGDEVTMKVFITVSSEILMQSPSEWQCEVNRRWTCATRTQVMHNFCIQNGGFLWITIGHWSSMWSHTVRSFHFSYLFLFCIFCIISFTVIIAAHRRFWGDRQTLVNTNKKVAMILIWQTQDVNQHTSMYHLNRHTGRSGIIGI